MLGDYSGVNVLMCCGEQAVAAGCRPAVTGPQPIVYAVLRGTAMLEILAVGPVPGERGPSVTRPVRTAFMPADLVSDLIRWAEDRLEREQELLGVAAEPPVPVSG
jgi:hypothetical protein